MCLACLASQQVALQACGKPTRSHPTCAGICGGGHVSWLRIALRSGDPEALLAVAMVELAREEVLVVAVVETAPAA
eukprot:CAMPEP_0174741728 /NCGR_PEP_ID=MMETSP1094-20130205/77069_1 /TAXON_ID=156173 /ORGANISM="Chrysochromulina brevifilum, Strain UTEX LB 985" /LENGTH=75 /DNA_ID=CAMNT_0015945665 /DNA_START=517 /DNA_END=741 /DNA_ORIENTATION=-